MAITITVQDIDDYLSTKKDNDIIGKCGDSSACIAHNVLEWKYSFPSETIHALITVALLEGFRHVKYPQDVEEVVGVFDNLKTPGATVTKAEFINALRQSTETGVNF